MKNLVWRVFQCMEIVGGEEVKNFSVWCLYIIWLLVSVTTNVYDVDCNKYCIQICHSNIQILKYTQEY